VTNVPTHDRPSKPRFIVRVLGALLLLVFLGAFSEFIFSTYFFLSDGRWIWPQQRWELQLNQFVAATTNETCHYIDTLYPHPYLLNVYNRNPPCSLDFVNSQGFSGRAFPFRRSNEVFAVLLTGGSVAAQLGQIKSNGPLFLEEALNACYKPPKGARFLVYNGAVGGWKQPQQTIVSLLYGDAYDAVVTLDGFNELQFLTVTRLEMANHDFELLNPLATRSSRAIIAAAITNQVQAWVTSSPARHSFAAYFFADRLRSWVVRTSNAELANRKTGFATFFALPDDWTNEERIAFNLKQYQKYIRAIEAVARAESARAAFFVQPVPAIDKRLTPQEQLVTGDLSYSPLYSRLTDALLATRTEGLQVFSLLDVFRDTTETIYVDSIHVAQDSKTQDSKGNRILARAMAEHLAAAWSLERTCP
jgi:hypothetical protein